MLEAFVTRNTFQEGGGLTDNNTNENGNEASVSAECGASSNDGQANSHSSTSAVPASEFVANYSQTCEDLNVSDVLIDQQNLPAKMDYSDCEVYPADRAAAGGHDEDNIDTALVSLKTDVGLLKFSSVGRALVSRALKDLFVC